MGLLVSGERVDQAPGCVVTEHQLVEVGAFGGGFGAAGEQGLLVLGERTDAAVLAALAIEPAEFPDSRQDETRAVALGLFDAIDEHPSDVRARPDARGPGTRWLGRREQLGEVSFGVFAGVVHPYQLALLLGGERRPLAAQLALRAGDGHPLRGCVAGVVGRGDAVDHVMPWPRACTRNSLRSPNLRGLCVVD
jgi:hypothetical protein